MVRQRWQCLLGMAGIVYQGTEEQRALRLVSQRLLGNCLVRHGFSRLAVLGKAPFVATSLGMVGYGWWG